MGEVIKAYKKYLPVTLTENEQTALFPLPSTAAQVTGVCPIVKLVPDSGPQVTETFPELSEATEGSHSTIAVGFPSSVALYWSSTQLTLGASLSKYKNMTKVLTKRYIYSRQLCLHNVQEYERLILERFFKLEQDQ